jgi:hypothetical protein
LEASKVPREGIDLADTDLRAAYALSLHDRDAL